MRFVQKPDAFQITTGGRSGTPILEMPNITKGNTLKVTAVFLAKTNGNPDSGFTYKIHATNTNDVVTLSSQDSIVQGNSGFQTTTKTVFFEARVTAATGIEDVDFEVIFEKGDFDGVGTVQNFLLMGQVVSLDSP